MPRSISYAVTVDISIPIPSVASLTAACTIRMISNTVYSLPSLYVLIASIAAVITSASA